MHLSLPEVKAIYQRASQFVVQQVRRNNRSLRKFYDAKYIDARTGEKVSGQDLYSGRRTRNKKKMKKTFKFSVRKGKKGYYSYRTLPLSIPTE